MNSFCHCQNLSCNCVHYNTNFVDKVIVDRMKSLSEIRVIVILVVFVGITYSSVLKSNGTAGSDLTAQMLIEFGRETNDSKLTLIGTLLGIYHPCTVWSEWSKCGATTVGFFSTRTRTRHCSIDTTGNSSRVETNTGVCEGDVVVKETEKVCPISYYNMSANGFCLRLYNTIQKTREEAKNTCRADGGFLINIDSDKKLDDVKVILTENQIPSQIYIDGQRKNSSSEWEYTYGSGTSYFRWFSGYPVTFDRYDCLLLSSIRLSPSYDSFRMYNHFCTLKEPFICEVVV